MSLRTLRDFENYQRDVDNRPPPDPKPARPTSGTWSQSVQDPDKFFIMVGDREIEVELSDLRRALDIEFEEEEE